LSRRSSIRNYEISIPRAVREIDKKKSMNGFGKPHGLRDCGGEEEKETEKHLKILWDIQIYILKKP
jgi:hypothetical protein